MKAHETARRAEARADAALLAEFLDRRDQTAFAALVARYGGLVFGVCRRRLGDRQEAEDAFQATFLTLALRAPELRRTPTLAPWLLRVAWRTASNARRKLRRRRTEPFGQEPTTRANAAAGFAGDLEEALLGLPAPQRAAVLLCHVQGCTRQEAAATLRCSEGTLSAWLHRALGKIRRRLREYDPAAACLALAAAPSALLGSDTCQAAALLPDRPEAAAALAPNAWRLTKGTMRMEWLKCFGPAAVAAVGMAAAALGYARAADGPAKAVVAAPAKETAKEPALTLSGTVHDASGKPLPKATVYIRTAAPRQGVGVVCPSCYPDCVKTAVTDADGKFALTEVDAGLVFRLLAVADGYAPAQCFADPQAGPAPFALSPQDLDTRDPSHVFRGRVLDDDGRPLAGATVEAAGYRRKGQNGVSQSQGVDSLAFTDKRGEFRMGIPEAGGELSLQAAAPFMAPRKFPSLAANGAVADLTLSAGVTVRGRLVKNGKPLPGGALGLAQKDRNHETFVGAFQAAAGKSGVFEIPNLPPDDVMALYGLMSSLRAHGAIAVRELRTGQSGSTINVGDVEVGPAYRFAGRVELAGGQAVPAGTRVVLSRNQAWDYEQTVVGADGSFAFDGLPAETYTLSAGVSGIPGYHLSPANRSVDPMNGFQLLGAVGRDIRDLRLLYEPGPLPATKQPDDGAAFDRLVAEQERCKKAPLQGAPAP